MPEQPRQSPRSGTNRAPLSTRGGTTPLVLSPDSSGEPCTRCECCFPMQRGSAPGRPRRSIGPASRWTIGGQNPVETGGIWDRTRLTQSPCLERFAGKKPALQFNGGLLAMQKVEGSSPFSRLARKPRPQAASLSPWSRALQRYGMLVADNGSDWFISGAPDPRWDNDDLRALGRLRGARLGGRQCSFSPRLSIATNCSSRRARVSGFLASWRR